MPLTDGKRYCEICKTELKPCFQSYFCPNDCDRIPQLVLREITEPIKLRCPQCASPDIKPVYMFAWSGHQCIDCKHFF